MDRVVVIAGPTASGKSALAVSLAQQIGGDIINADAMQVYRELTILTACPSSEDRAGIPHHLYQVADGLDLWSAGTFARAAAPIIEEIQGRGRIPIVVGGTGLWLRALTDGLSPMPPVPDDILDESRARLDTVGMEAFREEVLRDDPALDWLKPADTQRHLRAWCVMRATGRPLSEWQALPPEKVSSATFLPFVLCPERQGLYARCNDRFQGMVEAGALEEVRLLNEKGLTPTLPVMKAVGVRELSQHLDGEWALPDAIAAGQQATRHLVKRQLTWMRGQTPHWPTFDHADGLLEAAVTALA